MTLLLQELRKIWRPGILAALVALGAVYYYIRPGFYIEYFANGPVSETQFQLSLDWLRRYGPTVDGGERDRIARQLEEAEEAFRRKLPGFPALAEAGVTDYDSFAALYKDPELPEALHSAVRELKWGTACQTVENLRLFLERYDRGPLPPGTAAGGETPSRLDRLQIERVRELERAGAEGWGILPSCVLMSTDAYLRYLGLWCVVSAVLLLSPTLVRDRLHRTQAMQWSSRRGRRVLKTQTLAALLSGVLLTLLNMALYAGPFLHCHSLSFWDTPLYSVWPHSYPWFDWSYGTWLLALASVILLLSLGASALTVVLSRFSGNYVAMLLKALPLLAVLGGLVLCLMEFPFFFSNPVTCLLTLPGGELLCAAVLPLLGLLLCAAACRREGRRELL